MSQAVSKVSDLNIIKNKALPSPGDILSKIEKTDDHRAFVSSAREQIHNIIFGDDSRLLLIVGPCSIHDTEAAKEYASKLAELAKEVSDEIFICLRAYFEKPRTTAGWKGLIMDPDLDGSGDISQGLMNARSFLKHALEAGVPTATELLDPITPQYIADLICWSCIGARTTESQIHRQMASGLSMPVGFKNSTDGTITAAVNAIVAASHEQTFLGVDKDGRASVVTTKGNPNCHVVLRGGNDGPNYGPEAIAKVAGSLEKSKLPAAIVVDCSHGNSNKDFKKQPEVFEAVIEQAANPDSPIIGAMLESNLHEGNQSIPENHDDLKYGVSVTDACISWETTEKIIKDAFLRLKKQ